MKAHECFDTVTERIHCPVDTSTNVVNVIMAAHLVQDDDKRVCGVVGYTGMWKYLDEEKDAPILGAVSPPSACSALGVTIDAVTSSKE